jgi:hypothetical protein
MTTVIKELIVEVCDDVNNMTTLQKQLSDMLAIPFSLVKSSHNGTCKLVHESIEVQDVKTGADFLHPENILNKTTMEKVQSLVQAFGLTLMDLHASWYLMNDCQVLGARYWWKDGQVQDERIHTTKV